MEGGKINLKIKNKVRFSVFCILLIIVLVAIISFSVSKIESMNQDVSGEHLNNIEVAEVKNVSIDGIKKVEDIEFSNIRINLISKNKCEFLADVKNTTDKFLDSTQVRIKIINSKGEVDEVFGGIVTELASYEPNKFKLTVLSNLMDAKDVEIEMIN